MERTVLKRTTSTHRYLDFYLTDIGALARTLLADHPGLQKCFTLWSRDGYPSSSGGTRVTGTISDPTAQAVLASDEVSRDRDTYNEKVIQAHQLLKEADAIRAKYMTTTERAVKHNQGLTKCANLHGCPDDAWASKAGRCSACYEYNRRNQRDRTP